MASKHLEYGDWGPDIIIILELCINIIFSTLGGSGISLMVVDNLIGSIDDVLHEQ